MYTYIYIKKQKCNSFLSLELLNFYDCCSTTAVSATTTITIAIVHSNILYSIVLLTTIRLSRCPSILRYNQVGSHIAKKRANNNRLRFSFITFIIVVYLYSYSFVSLSALRPSVCLS